MWDLPRPGLKPVAPALAGGFLTVPLGKSLKKNSSFHLCFRKIFSLCKESLVGQFFFFFYCCKDIPLYSSLHCFQNLMSSLSLFFCLFFLQLILMFFTFSLVLSNLVMVCLGVSFFLFPVLEVRFLDLWVYSLHHSWKFCNHYFFNCCF